MIIRRLLAVFALLFASLGVLVAAPSAYAADCEGPATGKRGKEPLCDLVVGARKFELILTDATSCDTAAPSPTATVTETETVTATPTVTATVTETVTAIPSPNATDTSSEPAVPAGGEPDEPCVKPGGTVQFNASGFVRDAGGGQTLTFKLNDIDIIGSQEADASGNASGTIKLPAAKVFKKYETEYGSYKWWVRVLVGSGRPDGATDLPAASYHDGFKLVADLDAIPAPSPSSSPTTASTTPAATGTTSGTSGTTPAASGTLPNTGIEDHGVLLVTTGLALAALLALVIDRRLRRRTAGSA